MHIYTPTKRFKGKPMSRVPGWAKGVKEVTRIVRKRKPNYKSEEMKLLEEAAQFMEDPLRSPMMSDILAFADAIIATPIGSVGKTPKKLTGNTINAPLSGGAITNSFHVYKYGTKRKSSQLMANFKASFDTEFVITPGVDGVAVQDVPIFTAGSVFPVGYNNAESADYDTMIGNIPYLTQITNNPNQTKSAKIGSITAQTQFTNNGTNRATLHLYECVPKRDIMTVVGSTTYSPFTGVLGVDNRSSPVYCWDRGLEQTAQTAALSNEYRINMIGGKPTDSPLFNTFWEVKNKITVSLDPSQNHTHSAVYAINRTIPNTLVSDSTSMMLQGMTPVLMVGLTGKYLASGTYAATTVGASSKITISYKSPALTQSFRTDYQTNT